ncbi:MAG: cupin domain-containing protein [Chloroflexota bacterium]
MTSIVNFNQKLSLISEQWTPKNVAQMNDYHFKLVKIEGDFVWHSHADTDEAFIVIKGQLDIEMRDQTVTLSPGELYVVPKGVEHKPYAQAECHLLLVEPAGLVNTGDNPGELTASADDWI